MPAIIGALQTGRNTLQATRINAGQQVRGIFGGMGGGGRLSLQNNDAAITPDEVPIAGPMGLWPFPLVNMLKGVGGAEVPPPADTETVGLGVPSRVASIPGERGVASFDRGRAATGQRIW